MQRIKILNQSTDILNSIDAATSDFARLQRDMKKRDLAEAVERLEESAAPATNCYPGDEYIENPDGTYGRRSSWGDFFNNPEFSLEFNLCNCDVILHSVCEMKHKECTECIASPNRIPRVNLPGIAVKLTGRIDRFSILQNEFNQLLEDDYARYVDGA